LDSLTFNRWLQSALKKNQPHTTNMRKCTIEDLEARVASLEKTLRVLRGLIGRINSRADFLEGRL